MKKIKPAKNDKLYTIQELASSELTISILKPNPQKSKIIRPLKDWKRFPQR